MVESRKSKGSQKEVQRVVSGMFEVGNYGTLKCERWVWVVSSKR